MLALGAWLTLPALAGHLEHQRNSPIAGIVLVLRDTNHRKAFAFTALLMFGGFAIIPYITIFITANGGFTARQVPYLYLCGGAATLVTARFIGRLSDSVGKARMFSVMAILALAPMLLLSQSAGFGVWGILVVTTALFIGMNGRMVPGMALVASAANPQLRGTFMALNSSVQSAAMGAAAFVGGLIISRDAQGLVQHYWGNALVGVVATVLSLMLVRKLHLHGAPSQPIRDKVA